MGAPGSPRMRRDGSSPAARAHRARSGRLRCRGRAPPPRPRRALASSARAGSAVDAAIATNAVLGVVMGEACGLGGDAFWLVWDEAAGRQTALNGSGRAPAGADAASLRSRGLATLPHRGPLTITVPGAVRSWADAHDRWGRLPLAEILGPAIELARGGFPADDAFLSRRRSVGPDLRRGARAARARLPRRLPTRCASVAPRRARPPARPRGDARATGVGGAGGLLQRRDRGSPGRGPGRGRLGMRSGGPGGARVQLGDAARVRLSRGHGNHAPAQQLGRDRPRSAQHPGRDAGTQPRGLRPRRRRRHGWSRRSLGPSGTRHGRRARASSPRSRRGPSAGRGRPWRRRRRGRSPRARRRQRAEDVQDLEADHARAVGRVRGRGDAAIVERQRRLPGRLVRRQVRRARRPSRPPRGPRPGAPRSRRCRSRPARPSRAARASPRARAGGPARRGATAARRVGRRRGSRARAGPAPRRRSGPIPRRRGRRARRQGSRPGRARSAGREERSTAAGGPSGRGRRPTIARRPGP